jgi:alginate O-acetyltransferase complex protein AlgI
MHFNSPIFLFLFLPVFFLFYVVASNKYKNLVALVASLVFISWEHFDIFPLLVWVICSNYLLGLAVEHNRHQEHNLFLILGVVLNLLLLITYKALAANGEAWFGKENTILIPLGLSYIVFQVIAYLVDIHNEIHDSEKNFLNFAVYVLLFPKFIIGPFVRYRDIGESLSKREVTAANMANGARRFILGLAKKALIADQLVRIVNPAFDLPSPSFSTPIAWLVLIGYALQLYFDFSGYIDMAIGTGQMMGFQFVENFNYPYISKSISEFWRRWHISLSSWFRDYVFYPLEFTRKRDQRYRQQLHILIIFFLTGIWHGVTWNFVIWGMIHGLAVAVEMTWLGRWLKKTWAPLAHLYTLIVVLLGWAFFRSPTPAFAAQFLARLGGSQAGIELLPFSMTEPLPFIDNSIWLALAFGILFSLPIYPALKALAARLNERYPAIKLPLGMGYDLTLLALLVVAVAASASANVAAVIDVGF